MKAASRATAVWPRPWENRPCWTWAWPLAKDPAQRLPCRSSGAHWPVTTVWPPLPKQVFPAHDPLSPPQRNAAGDDDADAPADGQAARSGAADGRGALGLSPRRRAGGAGGLGYPVHGGCSWSGRIG